jgi:hypothetical protein
MSNLFDHLNRLFSRIDKTENTIPALLTDDTWL